jgi:formylglycine-generating enzyme required for sulfatase activity
MRPLYLLISVLSISLWSWECSSPTKNQDKDKEPELAVAPDTLDFGSSRTHLPLAVSNIGGGVLYWSIECPTVTWISVEPAQGEISGDPAIVRVEIDRARGPKGEFQKIIRVVGSEGADEEVVLIARISKPDLSLPGEGLVFDVGELSKTMTIGSVGTGELNWTVTPPSEPWLQVDSPEGTAAAQPSTITVMVDPSQVVESGTYETELLIDSDAGSAAIPVSMVVDREEPPARLQVSPDSLGFGRTSIRQVIDISSTDGSELAWQANSPQDWLKVMPASGILSGGSAQVIVEVDRALLVDRENAGFIVIEADGGKLVVPVTALVPVPLLWVNERVIDFRDDLNSYTFEIANAGIGDLTWTCAEEIVWLEVQPVEGVSSRTATPVTLGVQRQGLDAGSYEGELTISSNGGEVVIAVRMEVSDNPLSVDSDWLDFGEELTNQSVGLRNTGSGSLDWEVRIQATWLKISPLEGSVLEEEEQIVFAVDRRGLPAGTYTTRVAFVASGRQREVVVEMVVPESPNDSPVADAGPDKAATVETAVQLDGSGSSDPNGDPLTFQWVQKAGSGVELTSGSTQVATFTPAEPGDYVFLLIVNDGQVDSEPDEVAVTVEEGVPPGTEEIGVELPDGREMEFVWIDPGMFTMGSPESEPGHEKDESPEHEVKITRGFYLGKYEVTQAQWESVMGGNPSFYVGDDHPVEQVSWDDVQEFVHRWNVAKGDSLFRLPTEAEWEYACRAGTQTAWSFGDDDDSVGDFAWYSSNNDPKGAKEVGTKLPNSWGLHDMHGNVNEWVQDRYGAYASEDQSDPTGAASGNERVHRGGSFSSSSTYLRSGNRSVMPAGNRLRLTGARILKLKNSLQLNAHPVADAGEDRTVPLGLVVELDGRGSRDADGDILRYRWAQVNGPEVRVSPINTPTTTFVPLEPGQYVFALFVDDGKVESSPAVVVIEVEESPHATGETDSLDLPGGAPMEFVWIGPGAFTMGSSEQEEGRHLDEIQHPVIISHGFFLGKYEVTQAQWESVMGSNPSYFSGENRPVEQISWEDAQAFVQRLNEEMDEVCRLPTEAEWEYACRAGTTTRWSFGNDEELLGDYAWFEGNNDSIGTKEVGTKLPNPWGVYDMHGNVWEWCQDFYGAYVNDWQTDPSGPPTGSDRAMRGGYFGGEVQKLRSAGRAGPEPSRRAYSIGLRLVKVEKGE